MALPIPTKDALTGETVMLKLRRFWRYFVDWVESANPIIENVEGVGTQLTAIESRVDSQDARITQNTSDITQNANAIAVNSEQIQENILDITENADNIQSIEDELTVITPKVNKAVTDITNLDGEIADTNAHLTTVEGELDSHVANRNNPHGVTKEQLGLTAVMQPYGSVETYADLPADAPAGATYNVRQAYGDYPPNTNFTKTVSGEWDSMGGEVDFQPVYDSINDVATDLSAHITQSNTRFTSIETKNTQQDTAIANLDTNKQKKLTFGTGLDYNETTGELDINAFVGEVDSTLSTTSENPVQNKIITQALNGKQPTGDYATATQLQNLGSTVSDQGTQLSGLATTVQGLQTTIAGVNTKADENANDITALESSKQNKLTFDTTPTSGSNNPVTSNGIYTALQNAGEKWIETSTPLTDLITSFTGVELSGNAYYARVNQDLKIRIYTTFTDGTNLSCRASYDMMVPAGVYHNYVESPIIGFFIHNNNIGSLSINRSLTPTIKVKLKESNSTRTTFLWQINSDVITNGYVPVSSLPDTASESSDVFCTVFVKQ